MSELQMRVERLERQNRQIKGFCGTVLAVLVAVTAVAAGSPPSGHFDGIVCKTIMIEDDEGNVRGHFGIERTNNEVTLSMFDGNSPAGRIKLAANRTGMGLGIQKGSKDDKGNEPVAAIVFSDDVAAVRVRSKSVEANLVANSEESSLIFSPDGTNEVRAMIGALTNGNGLIGTFDGKGRRLWQAPAK